MSSIFGPNQTHLPPSPPGLPILGHLTKIPSTEQWKYFLKTSDELRCKLTTYKVLNQTIIVLNSKESIEALFTKKQDVYASKPPRKMSDISDLTMTLPFMDPGEVFTNARKQFHQGIGQAEVGTYNTDYEVASRNLIKTLCRNLECKNLTETIDDSLGHVFLKVSTGYNGPETESVLKQMNDLAHFAADVLGDKYQIFDILPFLASVPKSVPVIGPKIKLGKQWKNNLHSIAATTVRLTQESQKQETVSVMSNVYKAQGAAADGDEQSKMIAVTMNAGGMLASESATLTFLLAMAQHPDVQKRAQAQVDSVCGNRLPTMADRPHLPYVDAVLSEVLRWVSIAPVIAREVTEDDHYDGFLIPKGATIMANNYAISRDAEVFPDPESFVPARFLDESGQKLRQDVLHPMEFAFGFGRRTCPGRYLADALLFSHFAHILKVFDVALPSESEKAKRAADAELKVKSNGAACRLESVYVTLAPRSAEATVLINQNAPSTNGQADGHANGHAH
ncbi:cytochrome P450 [Dichomitus squalens]|nr:cytochrome P450 [Dichomitus squalens]